MSSTQIWQHRTSGEQFLVRVTDENVVVGANGPVSREDAAYTVNEASGFFDEEIETGEWITENEAQFRVVWPYEGA